MKAPFLPLIEHDDDDDDNDDEGVGYEGSHIDHLPDELLLLIFNKIVDAKCLCKCSLVSKRFSNIIPQVHSISLNIPPRYSLSHPRHSSHDDDETQSYLPNKVVGFLVNSFFVRTFRYVQVSIASKCLSRQFNGPLFRSAVESLKKFNNIRKLRVQLPALQRQRSLLKWQAEFGNDFNICVILFATSFRKTGLKEEEEEEDFDDADEEEESDEEYALTDEMLRKRIASANQCFSEALWRHHMLHHVVEDHRRTLKRVEITDSRGEGRVCLKERHLMGNVVDQVKLPSMGYAKVWHYQMLDLPLSGYVMEGVSVFAVRHTEKGAEGDEERLNSLMDGAFEENEEDDEEEGLSMVYKEVMRQIYENKNVEPITLNLNVPPL